MDEKVRYFVGPGQDVLNSTRVSENDVGGRGGRDRQGGLETFFYITMLRNPNTTSQLRPYAQAVNNQPPRPRYSSLNPYIPFSPTVPHHSLTLNHPTTGLPLRIQANDSRKFGKWYRSLSHEERMRVVAEQRKKWYEALVAKVEKGGEGEVGEMVDGAGATADATPVTA
jgi:hypothetical protein